MKTNRTTETKLLIDIGNSAIKTALCKNSKLFLIKNIDNDIKSFRKILINNYKKYNINKIIFTSVIGNKVLKNYINILRSIFDCPLIEFKSTKKLLGVKNAYLIANNLGSDRWAGIVGSYLKYKKPLCLVDCGTAISIDYVSNSGQHIGGYILNGVNNYKLSFNNVYHLKNIKFQNIYSFSNLKPSKSTKEGIEKGYTLMVVSSIEKSFRDFCKTQSKKPLLIISGGYGHIISKQLSIRNQYDPNIVLMSLAYIFE